MRDSIDTILDGKIADLKDEGESLVATWVKQYRPDGYEARKRAEKLQQQHAVELTNEVYEAAGENVEYTHEDLTGYSYRNSDYDDVSKCVMADDLAGAKRIVVRDEARNVYRRFDRHMDYAIAELQRQREVERKDQQVDDYIEAHTEFEWDGPAMQCMCRTLQYDRCGRKGKFISLQTNTRFDGYGTERRVVKYTFVRLECSAHATRFPKEAAKYNRSSSVSWDLDAWDEELASFATDQAAYLQELVEAKGVVLSTTEDVTTPAWEPYE